MLLPLAENFTAAYRILCAIPICALALQCWLGAWIWRRGRRKTGPAVLLGLSFLWGALSSWVGIQVAGELRTWITWESVFWALILFAPVLLDLVCLWMWFQKPKDSPPPADPPAAG